MVIDGGQCLRGKRLFGGVACGSHRIFSFFIAFQVEPLNGAERL
jgi:hypothetical protein